MIFEITNEHLIDGLLPKNFIWPDGVTAILAASDCAIRNLTNIPAGVTKIYLGFCGNLKSLDLSGANGLQEVYLAGSAIENLTNIPAGVTKLSLWNCKNLVSLDLSGANGLQEVDLTYSAIENLTNIPDCVTWFGLGGCKNLVSLDLSGANGLQEVILVGSAIENLTNIPAGVTKFVLTGCGNLKSLDLSGANGLQEVDLTHSAIENLTNIPDCVTWLDLKDCKNLKSLDLSGANGLQRVGLRASAIENLTNIPAGVRQLSLWDCKNLQSLDLSGANGLQEVDLGASAIENLINIPDLVRTLNLICCENLQSLDLSGANGLQDVNLSCSVIENLTNIPDCVTKLDLGFCGNLKSLDLSGANGLQEVILVGSAIENLTNIPAGVTKFVLAGCENLDPTPELLARLDEIEQSNPNARVTRPDHWPSKEQWIDEAKRELSEAIAGSGIVPEPDAIKTLFDRFTSEGLFAHSLADVKAAGEPVIDLIKKDSSNLKWMEEIASNYLDGCVNQPVQGWLEIAGYVAMYQEPVLLDKVEASKQVLARGYIVAFVTGLDAGKKPGAGVEVEFGNALMRQVHQRLLVNGAIKKPWLAIPVGVAHEHIIRSKLTDEVIDRAYKYIMAEVITKTPAQITELALGSQLRDGWCQAIIKGNEKISTELSRREAEYQSAKSQIEDDLEFYDYAQDRNSGSDDIAQEDRQKYEARYQKEFRGLTPAEKAEKVVAGYVKLGERRTRIDMQKDQMLGKVISERVKSARRLPQLPSGRSIRGVTAAAASRGGDNGCPDQNSLF